LVSPMRDTGLELLVGVTRDPQWGLVLAVGLGGVFVEVLDDVALTPLPVSPDRIRALVESLRGAALLHGVRGQQAAGPAALSAPAGAGGRAAGELGPRLEAREISPLRAAGDRIEALAALLTWRDAAPAAVGRGRRAC